MNEIDVREYSQFALNQKASISTYVEFIKVSKSQKFKKILKNYLNLPEDFEISADLEKICCKILQVGIDCEIVIFVPLVIKLEGKNYARKEKLHIVIRNGISEYAGILS